MSEPKVSDVAMGGLLGGDPSLFRLPCNEGRIDEGGLRLQEARTESIAITVIVVSYNGGQYIKESVAKIVSLGRSDLELIVIDGGSQDGTVEFLRENDDVIGYWVSERDHGIYDAMNKGWSLANLDTHIIYVGAGDYIRSLPAVDELQGETIYYGDVHLGSYLFRSGIGARLKLGNTLHHQALLIPKKIHPLPPFDLTFKTYADYDFNLRLYRQGYTFLHCDALSGYALPGGVSAQIGVAEMSAVVRKNYGYVWSGCSFLYGTLVRFKAKFKVLFS